MAYVLGYFFADGSIEDWPYFRAKYIKAISTDEEQISLIKKELSSKHTIEIIKPTLSNHRTKYRIRIGNANLYESLLILGLTPKKSLTMLFPRIPIKFLEHFIRGYFDGDGCVYIERYKGKMKRLSIIFTSGSKEFLNEMCSKLHDLLGLMQTKVYNSRRSFQLRYSTHDALKIFKFIYRNKGRYYLKRKYNIFTKALEECDNWKVLNLGNLATWRSS